MNYMSSVLKGQAEYNSIFMVVSQSTFTLLPDVQVTLDAQCALKDQGLKNSGSESTLIFSKTELCQ